MLACPYYQDFLKKGWLVPEGNGSNRVKLKNNQRLPREEPDRPIYKIIEDIAKDLKWDKNESYFANTVDDWEAEMERQLSAEDTVSVWTAKLDELNSGFKDLLKQTPSEAKEVLMRSENVSQQLKNY